jgi:hypothetical protein
MLFGSCAQSTPQNARHSREVLLNSEAGQAGLSTAKLVIHFAFDRDRQDQDRFPLSRE